MYALPTFTHRYLHVAADAMGVPPHIYGSAMLAYDAMVNDHQNQSLVISGESGAGKTECMKLLLQFLTEKSRQLVCCAFDAAPHQSKRQQCFAQHFVDVRILALFEVWRSGCKSRSHKSRVSC